MRYIYFLLFILLISCKAKQSQQNNADYTDHPIIVGSAPPKDFDTDGVVDYYDNLEQNVGSGVDVVSSVEVLPPAKEIKGSINESKKDIINHTTDVNVSSKSIRPKGLIAYSVPNEMQVGKEYSVKVRITKTGNKSVLLVGDREIPICDDLSSVKVESISISPVMSASLLSQKGNFEITVLSTEFQNIDDEGYTEWAWAVTPLRGGENNLKLNIKIRIKENGDTSYRDITVFEKKIKVKSNIGFNIKDFFSKNWQWFMGAIFIPIFQWLWVIWKKRKDKKDVS